MTNPWINLSKPDGNGEWYLPFDREAILAFNGRKSSRPEHRIELKAIPEPYIGDWKTARVVFLGLNPGFDVQNIEEHSQNKVRQAILANLSQAKREYPFYAYDPDLKHTGVAEYWKPRLRVLKEHCGLDDETFSRRILTLEWFPYHSKSSGLPREELCPSQRFNDSLIEYLRSKNDVIFLGLKAEARWEKHLKGLKVPFLDNPRVSYVTPKNTKSNPGLFKDIVELLRKPN